MENRRIKNGNVYMTVIQEQYLPLYLVCVGGWKHQIPIERPNGWPEFQWIQCLSGKGVLKLAGEEHIVREGKGMLLFPNEYHEYYALSEPWEVRWFSFNGQQAGDLLRSLKLTRSQVLQLSDAGPILNKMNQLIAAASSNAPMKFLECSGLIYQVLLDLHSFGSGEDVQSRHQSFTQLSPALQYIEDHANEPITLGDIAGQLSVSNHHACVLFKRTLGMRPFEYVNSIRLRNAKVLMRREPTLPIAEVSRQSGYENESYFIKVFKKSQGITPRKYREYFYEKGGMQL